MKLSALLLLIFVATLFSCKKKENTKAIPGSCGCKKAWWSNITFENTSDNHYFYTLYIDGEQKGRSLGKGISPFNVTPDVTHTCRIVRDEYDSLPPFDLTTTGSVQLGGEYVIKFPQ